MAETEAMESRLDGSSAEEKPEAKEDPWMAELIRCREEQSRRAGAEAKAKAKATRKRLEKVWMGRVARSWAKDEESDTDSSLEPNCRWLELESELKAKENRLEGSREKARAKHKAKEKARAKHKAKEKALDASKEKEKPMAKPKSKEALEAYEAYKAKVKEKKAMENLSLKEKLLAAAVANVLGPHWNCEEKNKAEAMVAKALVPDWGCKEADKALPPHPHCEEAAERDWNWEDKYSEVVEVKAKLHLADSKTRLMALTPEWANARKVESYLAVTSEEISDLTWQLDLEKIRGYFGDSELWQVLSRPEIRLVPGALALKQEFMMAAVRGHEIDRRRDGELESPNKDKEASPETSWRIMYMEEKLSVLTLVHDRLLSAQRGPDFSDMTEADRAAEAERLQEEVLEEARRLAAAGRPVQEVTDLELEVRAGILDFDPKQDGVYYNSLTCVDLATFDLAEESPIGPMRFTNEVYEIDEEVSLCEAVNILSVKVACSDVGFPIQVYGTVIARDSTDYKRVYLFHRDRHHCQLINSKEESLFLTGPKRGLVLLDDIYVETDLKIKDHQGQDRELSKGILRIRGIASRSLEQCNVHACSLATRLSTVEVLYAVMIFAVEATIAIEVLEGEFYGIVTAHTTSIQTRLVLYDSQLADHLLDNDGHGRGALKMMLPAVSVCYEDELIIIAEPRDGKSVSFEFTTMFSGEGEAEFTIGTAKMRLKCAWSVMRP